MPLLRPLTWLVSLAVHAALLLAIVGVSSGGAAFDTGSGNDMFVVEQGIALQGVAKFGEAEEMIETVDIPPVQPVEQPKEVKEVEPELNNVVTSTEAQHEEQVVKEDPKPIEDKPVEPVPVQEQAPQVATLIEQSSGQAQQGGDTTQRRAYLGTLSKSIERAKVNPRSRQAGTVMIRFTVGPDGKPDLTRRREELRLHGARRGGRCRARPRRALPADAPERRQGADRGERPLRVRHPLIADRSSERAACARRSGRVRRDGRKPFVSPLRRTEQVLPGQYAG